MAKLDELMRCLSFRLACCERVPNLSHGYYGLVLFRADFLAKSTFLQLQSTFLYTHPFFPLRTFEF